MNLDEFIALKKRVMENPLISIDDVNAIIIACHKIQKLEAALEIYDGDSFSRKWIKESILFD